MSDKSPAKHFSRYPLVWLSAYFAGGVALDHLFAVDLSTALAGAVFVAAACTAKRSLLGFLIPALFLPVGIFVHQIQSKDIAPTRVRRIYDEGRIRSGTLIRIEGRILNVPEPSPDGAFLTVRATRIVSDDDEFLASGIVRLFVSASEEQLDRVGLKSGDEIMAECALVREEQYRNPGVNSSVELLDQQGIDATATVKSPEHIHVIDSASGVSLVEHVYAVRQHLISEFRARFSPPTAGVLIASLLGDKHFLDRRTSDVFRDGGTFHVLVISGLHVTFIGGLLLVMTSLVTRRIWWQLAVVCGFLWAFTIAVGGDVPVVRASLMFTLLLFARAIHRSGSLLNAFGLSVLILLVWRSADLFTPSFQLTVASVGSIVGCAFPLIEKLRAIGSWTPSAETPLPPHTSRSTRRFCELLYWNEKAWQVDNARQIWTANLFKLPYLKTLAKPNLQTLLAYLFEGVLVTIIVQAWMLPLVVIYFHRISPAAVFLNLWVGFFLALETFAALIGVAIGLLSDWLAAPFLFITEAMNWLMMSVPVWVSDVGTASYRLPAYTGFGGVIYFAYFVAVILTSMSMFTWRPFDLGERTHSRLVWPSMFATLALACVVMLHPLRAPTADGRLTIEFLDVGQGDSALVTFPDGETMLIDGGGRPDFRGGRENDFEPDGFRIGESVVSEFLWEKGYSRIDYLLATHADADHIQGLADVARNFDIGVAIVGVLSANGHDAREFYEAIERRSVPLEFVERGDRLNIGGVSIEVFNPRDRTAQISTNNSSVVLRMTFGSRSFLFTGDIERETEAALVNDESVDLHSDVVKVPHHGSRTSSTESFVERVSAETAVISVGRRSVFGHPRPEVVARWQNAGARVRTTGANGTITVSTDGTDVEVRTFAAEIK